ncbi:hypothetical protein TCAL_00458 [Tigriopus californicus]|uniref:Splicing factor YJU2 n=1 Tax=Tigriopus californicus TaxID=6832 RepID=A0A553NFX8_TIGCA|nr:splicing factor YJU2-like [Tigriopus californicus]TRY64347.1 hypothetical protein TCAL_00458 [Tigriopus californicus]|eukprot:TCALIF_00458-PA protein Name:"Similar to CCDC94 Coiled-coil domain-containing protein 94 (Homo sapiens)" AED:0.00 eAED:0.00 QI:0/-1/0/1/-1/1/1/0/311
MSERKVLNKYYPPDFDPSKIPRSKVARNKTFIIRLMAPCNMRCTTCGEYIYKGRKFNARKEDVDDMSYIGLRIYRFYIKCTACLSEISFRTDPENTDYVLEAGATRNFEALAKAEKIEEAKQRAYDEELQNNPMKLLEERTEASKNEMARVEALEELQELNKREVKIDYEQMLNKYDTLRETEAQKQEQQDEAEIQALFGRNGGEPVKRLLDESDDEENEERAPATTSKVMKTEKATDWLSTQPAEKTRKQAWEKSIGSLTGPKKGGLGVLVKKKQPKVEQPEPPKSAAPAGPSAGLSLLGSYSDSEEDSS